MHVAGKDQVASAAARLGPVHRGVGVAQHVFRAVVSRARQRNADADAGEDLVPAHFQRRRQLLVNPLGNAGGVRFAADLIEQDGELVAAEARERVARSNAALEAPSDTDEELVAGLVSEAVVDGLEAIEIEVEHREGRGAERPLRALKEVLQAVDEQRSIRQIGERIVERLPLQLLLGLLARGDVARDAEGPHDVPPGRAAGASSSRPSGHRRLPNLPLLDIDERLPGAKDLLLVAQRLRRVLLGEEVDVGPTDGQRWARDAEPYRRVAVDPREAALAILEVDAVRDVVHQRLQQEDLILKLGNRGHDLARDRVFGGFGPSFPHQRDLA